MRIGFIGAGKVGFSLGKHMAVHGIHVTGYVSKNPASAQEAAEFTKSRAFACVADLVAACDLVFLAVPDGSIAPTWDIIRNLAQQGALNLGNKCLAHCSGLWRPRSSKAYGSSGRLDTQRIHCLP